MLLSFLSAPPLLDLLLCVALLLLLSGVALTLLDGVADRCGFELCTDEGFDLSLVETLGVAGLAVRSLLGAVRSTLLTGAVVRSGAGLAISRLLVFLSRGLSVLTAASLLGAAGFWVSICLLFC